MPKFSIIIPVYNRVLDGKLRRCLDSVATQVFEDFECLVVDDGSKEDVAGLVAKYDERFRCLRVKHQGRVIARNVGMEAATAEFLTWGDSDDALDPMYFATFDYHIQQEPEAKLWVCGVVTHGMVKAGGKHVCPRWTKLRQAWMPPVSSDGNHTLFNSGHVGTGMFLFHHECYKRIGPMPNWLNHNQVANGFDEWLGLEPGTTGYGDGGPGSKHARLIGNPYGDDHCFFQHLCLYYRVHLIQSCLYCQYIR